jgi:hypothetical protein
MSLRSVVNLRISRQPGSALESFDIVRNYSPSVLGLHISGHQETLLEESLVRDASTSFFLQQPSTMSATFRSDSAPSHEIVRPVVRENNALNKGAAATTTAVTSMSSAAPVMLATLADSQKHLMPVSPASIAPSEYSRSSIWGQLQRDQLQHATRVCCELLQLASHHVRQIQSLKALCEQQQRELQEAKVRDLMSSALSSVSSN